MRVRKTLFTACATALLFAGMTSVASAEAGTGSSMDCSDGAGGTEYVIDDTTITLAAETSPGFVMICYSTAGEGNPGQGTGGRIATAYATSFTPTSAAALVQIRCTTDYMFGVAPECNPYAITIANPTDLVTVTPQPNAVCVVYLGSCQLWAPGATIWTDTSSAPSIWIDTFNQIIIVNPPGQCIGVLVNYCP